MDNNMIRPETRMSVHGVDFRFNNLRRPPAPWKPGTFGNQTAISVARPVSGYDKGSMLTVEMRFDDNCKNGHNDFAITGVVRSPGLRDWAACGCLHEDIAATFPELAHLIKWHLTGTDGPLHYVANTVFLAGNLDCSGRAKGEPSSYDFGIRFGNSPITVIIKRKFWDWIKAAQFFNDTALRTNPAYVHFEPLAVPHVNRDGDTYKFADKFTFKGFECVWHECPFDNIREAQEFSSALLLSNVLVKVPTSFSEGKARELEAARRAAVWPEATDAELSVPREALKFALEARLPALLARFRADMEAVGFLWECPALEEKS